jgi:aldose 1-epimerase
VAGTPYDFRTARPIGPAPIDHNFVVDGTGLRTAAVLVSPETGTRLEVRSDQPGLQVYTGGALGGVALEPQRFPDSPNRPDFPSAVLRPGGTYRSRIEWVFARLPA